MNSGRSNFERGVVRLITGWAMLLLYLAAFSPVGLGLTAGFATRDRSHHIRVCCGANGPQVVLHHEGNCAMHRHGVVARALTIFAQTSDSGSNPDHVIQFAAIHGIATEIRLTMPVPANGDSFLMLFAETSLAFVPEAAPLLPPRHPPSETAPGPHGLRSTVLLI